MEKDTTIVIRTEREKKKESRWILTYQIVQPGSCSKKVGRRRFRRKDLVVPGV